MSAPLRIVLCGKSPAMATNVSKNLKPEYEVIHVILSPAAGIRDIPALLKGKRPPNADPNNIGTKDYSKPPVAIALGGGYSDTDATAMRDACKGLNNGVAWIRPDINTENPPVGTPEYGQAMVDRVKACLKSLSEQGKLSEDGVHFF